MAKKIKILFLSSELTPLAKVGGLGDVAGSLPKELKKLKADIRVIIPYYKTIKNKKFKTKKIHGHLMVPFGNKHYVATVYEATIPQSSVPLYLIHHHQFLSSGKVYDGGVERFMFFTQAINEFLKLNIFTPDVVHVNDWHPSNIISLIKKEIVNKKKNYKTLLTIHNLAMQGKMAKNKTKLFHPPLTSRKKNYNSIREGIINCGLLNTVSPTYAKEILTKQYSCGLLKILKQNKKKLSGVLNGIDLTLFHPNKDKYLKKNFSYKTIKNKKINKLYLQKKSGLKQNADVPVFGLVSRLTNQKGIELILDNIDKLAKLNAQFIFTGTGDKTLEQGFEDAQSKYPEKFYFLKKFDVPFGQQIYAGADIFLMPSKFEPCGLGQMIAMTYGAVPVVRATGGLKDTVSEGKTGFIFKKYDANELFKAINRAYRAYQNKKKWGVLTKNIMSQDLTWSNSAKQYFKLYQQLLKK